MLLARPAQPTCPSMTGPLSKEALNRAAVALFQGEVTDREDDVPARHVFSSEPSTYI